MYEDFVDDLQGYSDKIHRFLDSNPSNETRAWIRENVSNREKSRKISIKWKNKVSVKTNEDILEICDEFFHLINERKTNDDVIMT